jgi:hypothetical protein
MIDHPTSGGHQLTRSRAKRRAYVESKSRAMARSGDHQNFTTIRTALVAEGFDEAERLFQNRWVQEELNRFCRQAIEKNAGKLPADH